MPGKNNNKKYGLGKERELKKALQEGHVGGLHFGIPYEITRSRGSFGCFDVQAFYALECLLFSVKSVRQDYWSPNSEIKKLKEILVPDYCVKYLAIFWSPNKNHVKKRWDIIKIE